MAIRKPKPTSPGRRFASYADFAEITKSKPEKTLVDGLGKSGGRNVHGRKTARHRGGGAKRAYRRIDFKRRKDGVDAKVAAIEYDPNRSAYIALLHYLDGEKRYILAPQRLTVGMMVASGDKADIAVGNYLSGTVTVLLGQKDGTFHQETLPALPQGHHPGFLLARDFDGNGLVDFLDFAQFRPRLGT